MRLTTIVFIVSFMQVSGATFGQSITINQRNARLDVILKEIRNQSGYDIFFNSNIIDQGQTIDVYLNNASVEQALDAALKHLPLTYVIHDKEITLKRKDEQFNSKYLDKRVQPFRLRGKVVDGAGNPLVGANVSIKGSKISVRTDDQGAFLLLNVKEDAWLVISFIGYETKEIKARSDLRVIQLEWSEAQLDQIQIIGYGTETKRFSVGSVGTVNATDIQKQPISNPLLALQGQVPGLAVTASSGVPGSTALVQVRGQNTLGTSLRVKPYDQPLFIIDGVPFAPQNVNVNLLNSLVTQSYTGGISQATGLSPFNNINPNDIESISVLKDAAATSIYGSQGANGVVLITTKKGKAGKTTLDISLNTQFNHIARPVEFLNTQQYLQVRREAFAADDIVPTNNPNDFAAYAPDLTVFDQQKYTNWQNTILGKTSNNTDLHATVSGGNVSTTFLVSGGYTHSNYNYPGDFSDQRFTLHSALHNATPDERFTLDLIADYGYDQNKSAGYGGGRGVVLPPNLPDLRDPAGNLIWNYRGYPLNVQNFYSSLMQPTYLQNYNFNSALKLSYRIMEGLTFGANVGYNRNTTEERSENPARSQDPAYAEASASFGNNAMQVINVEPQLNYRKNIGKGVLSVLMGGTYKKAISDAYQVAGYGYSSDHFLESIIGATTTYPFETKNTLKYIAGFARVKYIQDQKYIIEASGRRDGSSNFGPGRQFGTFASVGAGWIFSEENLFKNILPFLDYGKLSGSYGTTGGDASKAYSYQALYQNISRVPAFQGVRPASAYNLYNPNFSWSTKKSLNLSLDLGLFDRRLSLNTTFYRNRDGNQLVDSPLPAQTGFTTVFGNLNALVQNQGWEFSLATTNIQSEYFSWTSNFNITFNRNKLLEFPDLESSSYADKYIIGQPTSIVFGYRYKGVNPNTGLYEFYDKNGDITSDPKSGIASRGGDQVPIGHMGVNYMGGFGNNLTYKNLSLYIFCQFSSRYAPNYLSALYTTDYPGAPVNQPVAILGNYWKGPGDQASIQRLAANYYSESLSTLRAFTQSDGVYSDDTYLRVKTVSLSYALPETFLQKVHVKGGSVYLNAQNLFTITNYEAGDPEQPGTFTAFPLQRIVALGVNFKF